MRRSRSFSLLTAAALGLVAPVNAQEYSLSVRYNSNGQTQEVFYPLGRNPSVEEFLNGKKQLGTNLPANRTTNCDQPGGPRCQPLWGDPIGYPGIR